MNALLVSFFSYKVRAFFRVTTQERGYFFRGAQNPIFEARPDGVLQCQNNAGKMVACASFELKPIVRDAGSGRERIRLEEGAQFVAMLSHDGTQKRSTVRSLEALPEKANDESTHTLSKTESENKPYTSIAWP